MIVDSAFDVSMSHFWEDFSDLADSCDPFEQIKSDSSLILRSTLQMTLQWKTNINIDQNTTYDITPIPSPKKPISGEIIQTTPNMYKYQTGYNYSE